MAGLDSCTRYSLTLASGQSWEMAATPRARPWLDRLASIMELENEGASCQRQIIFVKDGMEEAAGLVSKRSSAWRTKSIWPLQIHYGDEPLAICELGSSPANLDLFRMNLATQYLCSQVLRSGGVPLHAALVEHHGQGFIIAGPSGTGKSTCCRRLPSTWRALCDDFALVVRNREGQYCAHPLPTWSEEHRNPGSGKSWDVQKHVPLNGIFLLKQSARDGIEPLGRGEASLFIYHSISQACQLFWKSLGEEESIASRKALFDNACGLANSIPVFHLEASLTGHFWEQMEQGLAEVGAILAETS